MRFAKFIRNEEPLSIELALKMLNIHAIETLKFDTSCGSMQPSPYSIFLAKNLPKMRGKKVLDLGTGCGIQAVVSGNICCAKEIHVVDSNPGALVDTMMNCMKHKTFNVTAHPPGDLFSTISPNHKFDYIVCNPASLPQRKDENIKSCYYAGEDGRTMIEKVITQVDSWLEKDGVLLMTHTSLANLEKTFALVKSLGFLCNVKNVMTLKFRDFYDTEWITSLDGNDLYYVKDEEYFEHIYLLEIKR